MEMAAAGVQGSWKDAFLRQQFETQTLAWDRSYPTARKEVILIDAVPAGRLYVAIDKVRRRLHVIDIALLPRFQGKGIGTEIFRRLFSEAEAQGLDLSLQADPTGRAYRLYLALGFAPVQQVGYRVLMVRETAAPVSKTLCPTESSTQM